MTAKPVPSKVSVKSIKDGKKSFKVKFNKIAGATGYQIRYRDYSSKKNQFKTVKSSKSAVTATVSKLKKKHKYVVNVRAYRTVNGKKIYGKWSQTKRVKVK